MKLIEPIHHKVRLISLGLLDFIANDSNKASTQLLSVLIKVSFDVLLGLLRE